MTTNTKTKILAIDTSCDETSSAVTEGVKVLSNIVWSQASLHAKFGGVYPSLAQREHKERIDWVINKAIQSSKLKIRNLDAIAVTVGPGLAVALGVGIDKAKELAIKYNKPIIGVNHIEGHLLSPFAQSKNEQFSIIDNPFPALGLVVSGGTTQVILAERLGYYKILANTVDDALGEALDKGARLLGLGYPGGAILEKIARDGKKNSYPLPIPMLGRENLNRFSYSGLKTALVRLVEKIKKEKGQLSKTDIQNLALVYQDAAFTHLIRVFTFIIHNSDFKIHDLFVGGGVGANIYLRKLLRKMSKEQGLIIHFPYSKALFQDNAAMIGVAGYFSYQRGNYLKFKDIPKIDRLPKFRIDSI